MRRIDPGVIRVPLPFVRQTKDFTCGPAVLLSVFIHFGVTVRNQETLTKQLKSHPHDGTDAVQMERVARRYKLRTKLRQPMTVADVVNELIASRPVIVAIQAHGCGHWVGIVGYDRKHLYALDPMIDGRLGYWSIDEFGDRWHDDDGVNVGLTVWKSRPNYMRFAVEVPR